MAGFDNRDLPDPPDRGRWTRLPESVRARIFYVALTALIPLALFLLGSALVRLFTTGSSALRENRAAARTYASAGQTFVQGIRDQETIVGSAIGTRGAPNWGWTNGLLRTTVGRNPSMRSLSWLSSQGLILASSNTPSIGRSLNSNAIVQQLISGQTEVVSDVLPTGPISGNLSIVMAHAIRSATGQLLGITVAEIDPDALSRLAPGNQTANGALYAVFDHQGRLVSSNPPRPTAWSERGNWQRSDPVLRNALRTGKETHGVVTPASFATAQYAVYAPVATTGYVVGVLRPRTVARAPAWRNLLIDLLFLALVTGLVWVVAHRVSRSIVDPLQTLRDDAERLGQRETVQPPTESAPVEIRELHAAVTGMAALLLQHIDTLEAERDRLNLLFAALPVGVRFVNANGEVLLANPIAREMLGEDAVGMASTPRGRYTLHRLDGSPLPLPDIPLVRALHEEQSSRNVEVIVRYENGDGLLALFSANPVYDAEGALAGVVEVLVEVLSDVAALQNITESTNLEQQLAAARTQLQTLLEILPVGVTILDAQGHIINANAEMTRLWGGLLPEINSTGDFRFLHGWWTRTGEPIKPEEWPAVRALTRNATVMNEAITLNRFDGLRGDVLTSAAPLHDALGAISGAVWVLQDAG